MRLIAALLASSTMAAPASAQMWTLDPAASEVGFSIEVFGSAVTGSFSDASAEIVFDPEDLSSARIDAVVRTASGEVAGASEYEDAMNGSAGLAPSAHPEARFVSDTIRAAGGGYEADGVLTIKGVEKAVTLPFTVVIDGEVARASGAVAIERTDFGVNSSSWSNVGERVTISLDITARAAQ